MRSTSWRTRFVGPLGALLLGCACGGSSPATLAGQLCRWEDHPANPLIAPPQGESLVGDPTVLTPDESPDGRWHLFADTMFGLQHYHSPDGVAFERVQANLFGMGSFRPFLLRDGGRYHLFYEAFTSPSLDRSEIRRSESADLLAWGDPVTVLRAELPWETEGGHSTVGNPFVTLRQGRYWLYYSASGVLLPDVSFYEPRYIGLARADALAGPYAKEPQPLLGPSAADPFANLGAGSLKLLDEERLGQRIALQNGIYRDGADRSRSAIRVLSSTDGLAWAPVCPQPILAPTDSGWKSAFVYAFDTVRFGAELRIYYNAREGWTTPGVERIGMARLRLPSP